MYLPDLNLKDAVIYQPWGGLGDNLQFSTLPEMFASHGIRTLVSACNAVRNPEINSLVWGMNPFIGGVSDAKPNAGQCRCVIFDSLPKSLDFIERIECAHGFEPTHHFPKVYYKSKPRPDLSGAVIVDVGSTSVAAPPAMIADYLAYVFANYGYREQDALQVRFLNNKVAVRNTHRIACLTPLTVTSIFEFCDIITSCGALVTVHSGAQTLAVALRENKATPLIHCFCTTSQYNLRNYIWNDVEYYVASADGGKLQCVRKVLRDLCKSNLPRITEPLRQLSTLAGRLR